MRALASLMQALGASDAPRHQAHVLAAHVQQAGADDAIWALYLLAGGKVPRVVQRTVRGAALAMSGLPAWLMDASLAAKGDLAEWVAHALPPARLDGTPPAGLAEWMALRLPRLRSLRGEAQQTAMQSHWAALSAAERDLHVRVLGGGLRLRHGADLVAAALSHLHGDLPQPVLQRRVQALVNARRAPVAQHLEALLAPLGTQAVDTIEPEPDLTQPGPTLTVRAVVLYVPAAFTRARWAPEQASSGVLGAEYGFAVWNRLPLDAGEVLAVQDDVRQGRAPTPGALRWLPLAKAPCLWDIGAQRVLARQLQAQVVQRFGPVALVVPHIVCELDLHGLKPNGRRKSGLEVQRAELIAQCPELGLQQADSLAQLHDRLRVMAAPQG